MHWSKDLPFINETHSLNTFVWISLTILHAWAWSNGSKSTIWGEGKQSMFFNMNGEGYYIQTHLFFMPNDCRQSNLLSLWYICHNPSRHSALNSKNVVKKKLLMFPKYLKWNPNYFLLSSSFWGKTCNFAVLLPQITKIIRRWLAVYLLPNITSNWRFFKRRGNTIMLF